MPPHIEIDSHHDDGLLAAPRSSLALCTDDAPSPLFHDSDSLRKPPPTSPLDRRQSDPEFVSAKKEAAPANGAARKAAAPAVSRITAIIGPESAYVRAASASAAGSGGRPSPKGATAAGAAAKSVAAARPKPKLKPKPSPPNKNSPSPNGSTGGKTEGSKPGKSEGEPPKPKFLRRSQYLGKKGWKLAKSLPGKMASAVGRRMKIPGHHRNVV